MKARRNVHSTKEATTKTVPVLVIIEHSADGITVWPETYTNMDMAKHAVHCETVDRLKSFGTRDELLPVFNKDFEETVEHTELAPALVVEWYAGQTFTIATTYINVEVSMTTLVGISCGEGVSCQVEEF